ncbi:ATP-binding protein [Streptomyces sp. NPDC101152]|uniref:ATP-binding protein n=1 Tax=Streptomyces sp. NPDC101152 TaxID=3366116 RepID=UPI0037FD769D
MTAPTPPGERPTLRSVMPAPLLAALLAAIAVAGAVARVPLSERVPLTIGAGVGAVLLVAAVSVAAHAVQTTRLTRRRLDAVAADTGRLLQDRIRQSAEFDQERVRLTEELTHERARVAAEIARERARLSAEFGQERARFAAENARLAERARQAEHDRAAAVSATANAAGRMQALATGTLADLRAMEERHSDEDVLADLLHLDHRTAQAGRLADSVAVLAGARSGRRWARPIAMESILRGAMGRISGYRRVRVHSASEAAVAGHAAEGVMHALAELLDNAANFSPPSAEVHVYVEEVPAGVIVSVEDSGLVMGEVQLRRAQQAVSGDTDGLGGLTGTRLGLAVVGRLARKHGLKVSYRPSARGGTGVLLLIPQDILVPTPQPTPPPLQDLPPTKPPSPTDGRTGTPTKAGPSLPGKGEPRLPGTGRTGTPSEAGTRLPGDERTQTPTEEARLSGAGRTQAPGEVGTRLPGGWRSQVPAEGDVPLPSHGPAQAPADSRALPLAGGRTPTPADEPDGRQTRLPTTAERRLPSQDGPPLSSPGLAAPADNRTHPRGEGRTPAPTEGGNRLPDGWRTHLPAEGDVPPPGHGPAHAPADSRTRLTGEGGTGLPPGGAADASVSGAGSVRGALGGKSWMPADGEPWPSGGDPLREAYEGHRGVAGTGPDSARVRAHESHPPLPSAHDLPQRRRGQALAAAERERDRARARAADVDAGPAPVTLDDPLTRAARFSSFRRAVHGSLSDQAAPDDPGAAEPHRQADAPSTDAPRRHDPAPDPHPKGTPAS